MQAANPDAMNPEDRARAEVLAKRAEAKTSKKKALKQRIKAVRRADKKSTASAAGKVKGPKLKSGSSKQERKAATLELIAQREVAAGLATKTAAAAAAAATTTTTKSKAPKIKRGGVKRPNNKKRKQLAAAAAAAAAAAK